MLKYPLSLILLSTWYFFVYMGQGDHSETLLLLELLYWNNPSSIKVRGWKWKCAISYVEQLLFLDLAVHLVTFSGRSETLLLLTLFYQSTPSCLIVRCGKWECAGGHVELPLVLDLAVHLVIFLGRWVKVIILKHF